MVRLGMRLLTVLVSIGFIALTFLAGLEYATEKSSAPITLEEVSDLGIVPPGSVHQISPRGFTSRFCDLKIDRRYREDGGGFFYVDSYYITVTQIGIRELVIYIDVPDDLPPGRWTYAPTISCKTDLVTPVLYDLEVATLVIEQQNP